MNFVTRKQWGAAPPRTVVTLPAARVDTVFFHYTAMDADEQVDHRNCAGRVRGIQWFHTTPNKDDPTKPWSDLAYSFIVCKHGYVFEGRSYGVHTAATGNDNNHSLAVCFLGDDTKGRDDITAKGRGALVDITRGIERWAGKTLRFRGHCDVMSTACPGNELVTYIRSNQFAYAVRRKGSNLRERTGFYAWAAWRLGEGDWQAHGPRNPAVRPHVPHTILVSRPLWFPRLVAMIGRRKV